jgi:hypothetical protein
MRLSTTLPVLSVTVLISLPTVLGKYQIHQNYTNYSPYYEQDQFALFKRADRPDDCPPCFNCNLEDFRCHQFAPCNKANGRCDCPAGFGGDDCSLPLCQSLADGNDRAPPKGKRCFCKEGWTGLNCNVCKTDDACNALMPENEDGVCYTGGVVVKENFQTCDITNKKILDQLKEKKPQASFSCNREDEECGFQCKSPDSDLVESSLIARIQFGSIRESPSTVDWIRVPSAKLSSRTVISHPTIAKISNVDVFLGE